MDKHKSNPKQVLQFKHNKHYPETSASPSVSPEKCYPSEKEPIYKEYGCEQNDEYYGDKECHSDLPEETSPAMGCGCDSCNEMTCPIDREDLHAKLVEDINLLHKFVGQNEKGDYKSGYETTIFLQGQKYYIEQLINYFKL